MNYLAPGQFNYRYSFPRSFWPRKPIIKPLSYNLDNQLRLPTTTGTTILQPYIMIEVKMQNQR